MSWRATIKPERILCLNTIKGVVIKADLGLDDEATFYIVLKQRCQPGRMETCFEQKRWIVLLTSTNNYESRAQRPTLISTRQDGGKATTTKKKR